MSRFWVKIDGNTHCYTGNPSTCFRAQLEDPSTRESDLDLSQLRESTDRINGILEEMARNLPRTGLEIAFLLVPGSDGQDRIQLSYVDTSVEVSTYFG